jgi:riboflavin kinase/FMN adenylyltransferase
MRVYRKLDEIENKKETVLTVGTFDGVHLGHKHIFDQLISVANNENKRSVVVTFFPHPRTVVSKNFDIKLLTTFEEKVDALSNIGIDNLVVVKFDEEFSKLSSSQFIADYLVKQIGLSDFIIGHDHKFGKDRGGDEVALRENGIKHNFNVVAVTPVNYEGEIISSTKIRNALTEGDLDLANKFLGRYYSFEGSVIKGATRGRILGFPTANISVENSFKLIPKTGVYAVRCSFENKVVFGVMNIGYRPTFISDGALSLEVHIFDFEEDVYGKSLKVELLNRIRDEKKFNSKEELIYQIERDKRSAINEIGKIIN